MRTLLHASDLHFGVPHDPDAAADLLTAIEEEAPDLLVLSGDFTQRAKVSEYRAARAWIDRLPPHLPMIVTPGNHDVPLYRFLERIRSPFRNYRRWISPELDTVTEMEGIVAVALNTAAPRRAITNGRLDGRQLEWAREAFGRASPDAMRVVVMHHHLAPAPDYEKDRPLPGGARILGELEAMGVELILAGHLHRAYVSNSLDILPTPGPRRGIVISQSGTTTSRRGRARERARQSFNRIRITDEQMEITHFMRLREVGRFVPFGVHLFPRGREGHFTVPPFIGPSPRDLPALREGRIPLVSPPRAPEEE